MNNHPDRHSWVMQKPVPVVLQLVTVAIVVAQPKPAPLSLSRTTPVVVEATLPREFPDSPAAYSVFVVSQLQLYNLSKLLLLLPDSRQSPVFQVLQTNNNNTNNIRLENTTNLVKHAQRLLSSYDSDCKCHLPLN